MIKTLLFDFSRTLLLPKESTYTGKLNDLYRSLISNKNYNFYDHFVLNEELLDYLEHLKDKYTLAIYTTDIIQNDPAIKPALDKLFSYVFAANDLTVSKREAQGYLVIAKQLNNKPVEILFIDDLTANIEAAKQAGLQIIQFISNKQLFEDLKNIIPIP